MATRYGMSTDEAAEHVAIAIAQAVKAIRLAASAYGAAGDNGSRAIYLELASAIQVAENTATLDLMTYA